MNALDSIFKVVIVHEDSVAGLQAANVLRQLGEQLGNQLRLDINPWLFCNRVWQFDWLQDPELWEQAVAKAVEANMIIISTGQHTELPASVRSWIESVLPRKQGVSALVALLGGRREMHTTSLPPARYLRQLARQYGVDFFCNQNDQLPRAEPDTEPILCQFEDDSAFSPEVIPQHSDRRGWGIND
jgi:hypothetical protein